MLDLIDFRTEGIKCKIQFECQKCARKVWTSIFNSFTIIEDFYLIFSAAADGILQWYQLIGQYPQETPNPCHSYQVLHRGNSECTGLSTQQRCGAQEFKGSCFCS